VALTVDWDLAARLAPAAVRASGVGTALLRRGPLGSAGPAPSSRAEREDLVAGLRDAAPVAAEHVARITRLGDPATPLVRVVDRPGWARANVAGVRGMVALGTGSGTGATTAGPTTGGPITARAQAGAVQLAGVLGLLSGAVLGQLDPWGARAGSTPGSPAPAHGTLLLVAPNVLTLERSIGAAPADFRLWVTLHEQTHAQQVAAAPWLPAHLARGVLALLDAPDGPDDGAGADDPTAALSAVMALLEGHADVTMDAVGPRVVPSVRALAVLRPPGRADHRPAPGAALGARPGRQARPVPGRRRVRPRGAPPGRHRRAQRGVDLAGPAAHPRRDRGPRRLGASGARLTWPGRTPPSPPCAPPSHRR
jgi:uncharacterized protein (DUF2342 family)